MAPGKRKRSNEAKASCPPRRQQRDIPETYLTTALNAIKKLLTAAGKGKISELDIYKMIIDEINMMEDDELVSEIMEVLESSSRRKAQQVEDLVLACLEQELKARQVFHLLDPDGKGVVTLQDLQRVAPEILGKDNYDGDDDLAEMLHLFDADGILTQDKLMIIAKMVKL